jgi:hypothetical protein
MTELNLLGMLDELQKRYRDQFSFLQHEVGSFEAEMMQILDDIRDKEAERDETSKQLFQARKNLDSLEVEQQEEALDIVIHSLQQCLRQMLEVSSTNLDLRNGIQNRKQALLDQDPSLALSLEEFKLFEKNYKNTLATLPEIYKNTIIEAHNKLKEKLANILEIEHQLEKLPLPRPIQLLILQSYDKETGEICWVLPAPTRSEDLPDSFGAWMDEMESAFIRCIATLPVEKNTILDEVARNNWAGYRCITTLSEETDEVALAGKVQEHLGQTISEFWMYPDRLIQNQVMPSVVSLDWDFWSAGVNRTYNVEESLVEKPAEVEVPNPLFSKQDYLVWDRPLRVTAESLWTVSARRLRSLFMRLAAQGRIGKQGLPEADLLCGLPEPHRSAILARIEVLLQEELLISKVDPSGNQLFINPVKLTMIQDLINRDVTAFWAPIVQDEATNPIATAA